MNDNVKVDLYKETSNIIALIVKLSKVTKFSIIDFSIDCIIRRLTKFRFDIEE